MSEVEKPPLGVMPEWRWLELRIQDLQAAIDRADGISIKVFAWAAECERHKKTLEEYRKLRQESSSPNQSPDQGNSRETTT